MSYRNAWDYQPFVPRSHAHANVGILGFVPGLVEPATIYDKLREIRPVANNIIPKIISHIDEPSFVRAAQDWDANFQKFWNTYLDSKGEPHTSNVLNATSLFTEEKAVQLSKLRAQLDSMTQKYNVKKQERDREREEEKKKFGIPISPDITPTDIELAPEPEPEVEKKKEPVQFPWWLWLVGGAALAAGAYYLYRQYAMGESLVRTVRERMSRDPEPRMLGMGGSPGRAPEDVRFEYRPYMHPHLIPIERRLGGGGEHQSGPETLRSSYYLEE